VKAAPQELWTSKGGDHDRDRRWRHVTFLLVFMKRNRSLSDYIAALCRDYRRVRHYPQAIDLELTHRCNLRCPACWFHGIHGVGDRFVGRELSTHEVLALLAQVAQHRPSLYFGGAEPLLRPDFPQLAAEAASKGLRVAFTTNATLLDREIAEGLVSVGVAAVNVSLDGPEDVHDGLRGPGTFRLALGNLVGLLDARARRQATRPEVVVNITVNPAVVGRLQETVELLREATSDRVDAYRIHHLWFVTEAELQLHQEAVRRSLGCSAAGAAGHLLPMGSAGSEIDATVLASEISELRGSARVVFFPDLEGSEVLAFYSEGFVPPRRCRRSSRALVIKPDGSVTFCPDEWADGYVLGNVRETPLLELWRSKQARQFRRAIRREGLFPACGRCSWLW